MTHSENMVQTAIDIILSDKVKYNSSLNYAVNYCRAAKNMTGEGLRVQCLYILCNITSWRHVDAKNVRTVLKNFSK